MTKSEFKEFVNKESFETMVQGWKNLFITNSLSSSGIKKYELMKKLLEWKKSNYNESLFEQVLYRYEVIELYDICMDGFFDIE